MPSFVEFHDSTISAIGFDGAFIRISVDAYVHRWDRVDATWKGTGLMQPIQIVLATTSNAGQPDCPVTLVGGEVQAGQIKHKNMVPLPFDSSGPATLRLELATGKVLDFYGSRLSIESTGAGRYVEDLPDDFRPSSG